jgi:hypothetical protein
MDKRGFNLYCNWKYCKEPDYNFCYLSGGKYICYITIDNIKVNSEICTSKLESRIFAINKFMELIRSGLKTEKIDIKNGWFFNVWIDVENLPHIHDQMIDKINLDSDKIYINRIASENYLGNNIDHRIKSKCRDASDMGIIIQIMKSICNNKNTNNIYIIITKDKFAEAFSKVVNTGFEKIKFICKSAGDLDELINIIS